MGLRWGKDQKVMEEIHILEKVVAEGLDPKSQIGPSVKMQNLDSVEVETDFQVKGEDTVT